jgi:hypothetical protein
LVILAHHAKNGIGIGAHGGVLVRYGKVYCRLCAFSKEGRFYHFIIKPCVRYRFPACRVLLHGLPEGVPCLFLYAEKRVFSSLFVEIQVMCHDKLI